MNRDNPITVERITDLLRFLPVLEDLRDGGIVEWHQSASVQSGTVSLPYPVYDEKVGAFFTEVNRWWNAFDYVPTDAAQMAEDDKAIERATIEEVKAMLMWCSRGERFCDGHRGSVIASGIVAKILRRLKTIHGEMTSVDKYRGALIGLAVCDALGTTVEFCPPGSFKPMTDIVGGGPFHLKPGQWTDDTSLALCLAESLIEKRGFDRVDQLERYVRWHRHGHMSSTGECFDIGGTTSAALAEFERTRKPYCGSTDPHRAGNGSIMRLAPVPLFFARAPVQAIEKSGDSSRTTHGARTCVDACRHLGGLIVGAVNGAGKDELLSELYCPVPGYWQNHPLCPEIDGIARGSFKRKEPPDIKGTGYAVESLEAALWAFHKGKDFREGALLAVNLGDDADTTGAVYGQIAGAFYGYDRIPEKWRDVIAKRDMILGMADGLHAEGIAE